MMSSSTTRSDTINLILLVVGIAMLLAGGFSMVRGASERWNQSEVPG